MTRLFLASIAFAILQLGIPQSAGAVDLRPAGESTCVVPRFEAFAKAALPRFDSMADDARFDPPTPCAPAARTRIALQPRFGDASTHDPARFGGGRLLLRLPPARAPPA